MLPFVASQVVRVQSRHGESCIDTAPVRTRVEGAIEATLDVVEAGHIAIHGR